MKPTILILFLLWTTSTYPSDEPSTQEDSKVTKDLSEEEVAEIKKDNDEINERNKQDEAYCDDPNGGKRILLGSYISQEDAAQAVSEQPDPTICYVE